MVFHSRFQMDSFRVKKKNRSFLKKNKKNKTPKKTQEKYINFHLTAIHLMKDFFSNDIFRQCVFENSFLHF